MKKLIIAAAIVCAAAVSQAAAVGWNCAGATDFKGGDYSIFVLGMNGVKSDSSQATAQIKAIVEAGGLEAASAYAFGGDVVNSSGAATKASGSSGKTITYSGSGTDTYSAFIFVQDADGEKASFTDVKSITMDNNSTGKTFQFQSQSTAFTANKFDVAPEPTSGLLLLIGVAGLALRRRRA